MKKYKAIFFDWDGTAVTSRNAPVDKVAACMKELLAQGVKLIIISGTTIENIGGGKLHEHFTVAQRQHLFYGLGRGAYNYIFDSVGEPQFLCDLTPSKKVLLNIHKVCFDIHQKLLKNHDYETDVVFSRPNYCKIDIMVDRNRGEQLFFQDDELKVVKKNLMDHGLEGGLVGLIRFAEEIGKAAGLELTATTDAKYLEVGLTSKSDNVNTILDFLEIHDGIEAKDCTFWGDEYVGMDEGLFGSDSFMITRKTIGSDFFDVSEAQGQRPPEVVVLNNGVERFLEFLKEQAWMH